MSEHIWKLLKPLQVTPVSRLLVCG